MQLAESVRNIALVSSLSLAPSLAFCRHTLPLSSAPRASCALSRSLALSDCLSLHPFLPTPSGCPLSHTLSRFLSHVCLINFSSCRCTCRGCFSAAACVRAGFWIFQICYYGLRYSTTSLRYSIIMRCRRAEGVSLRPLAWVLAFGAKRFTYADVC
jgi:hypothetical protein